MGAWAHKKIDLDSGAAITAAIIFGVIAISIFPVMPIFVGALNDYLGFSASQSGYIASADIIGMATGNAIAFFWVRHVSWRKMAVLAVTALVAGNLICITLQSFVPMLSIRFVIGLAEGTALALTYAMLGGSNNPDRNYGLFLAGSLGSGAINVYLLSQLVIDFGPKVFFIDLAVLSGLSFWFLRFIPDYGYLKAISTGPKEQHGKPEVLLLPVIIALIANLIYFIGQGGVWVFLDRIGIANGLASEQVAMGISVSLILGVLGALAASVLDVRWGRVLPLALAIIAAISCIILLQWKIVLITFMLAVGIWNFANNFGHPYLLGYLAAIDKSGRFVVVSGTMQTGGMGLGPAIAAMVITGSDYDNVLWFGLVCFALTLLLFMPVMMLVRGVDNRDVAINHA